MAWCWGVTGNVQGRLAVLRSAGMGTGRFWGGLGASSPARIPTKCFCCLHSVRVCSVTQSCPTLCNPMDCVPPGPSVHGILQARTLEWAAVSSSRGSSSPRDWIRPTVLQADSSLSEIQGKPLLPFYFLPIQRGKKLTNRIWFILFPLLFYLNFWYLWHIFADKNLKAIEKSKMFKENL